MNAKRVSLFLTAGLLLLSIGAGYATQERHTRMHATLQALETARFQLSQADGVRNGQRRAQTLQWVQQAIRALKSELREERKQANG